MLNLSFEHYARVEATLKLALLHLDTGQTDGIVDGASMLSEEASLRTILMPESVKFVRWLGEFRQYHFPIAAAGRSSFFLELQGMTVVTPVLHSSNVIVAIMQVNHQISAIKYLC